MNAPALLRLVRPALAPTAAADVLAAAAFAGGAATGDLALAVAGSVLLYAGGMAQNDVCDRESDRTLHPDRPLVAHPSLLNKARILTALLFVAGVTLCGLAGAIWPALIVAVLASAYNLGLKKRFPFESLTLGAARATNLWIGFAVAGASMTGATFTYSLAYLLYIGGVTAASRCEDLEPIQTRRLGLLLAFVPMLVALILLAFLATGWDRAAIFLVPLAMLAVFLVRAVRAGTRGAAMHYILRCLQMIFVLHACTLWARGLTGWVIPQLVCAAISFFLLGALAPRKRPQAESGTGKP